MKLTDRKWKEFELSGENGIFQNFHGKRLVKENRIGGAIPLLTAGESNQGVSDFISNQELERYSDCISIDMFGNAFYHEYVCCGDDNIYFFINNEISKEAKLFIVTCINNNKSKYSYGKQFRQRNADTTRIMLPINKFGEPDFEFMERYVKYIATSKKDAYKEHISSKLEGWKYKHIEELNKKDWKEFAIDQIFNVYTGTDLIVSKIKSGEIPVITHSASNNGIACWSEEIPNRTLFSSKKTISLADRGNFAAYVQPHDFYIGTRVKALEFKTIVPYESMFFIASQINKQSVKFSYGYNACDNINRLKIMLSVDSIGNPDFEFMEQYIKNMMIVKYQQYEKYQFIND